jgi:hypothetical protein
MREIDGCCALSLISSLREVRRIGLLWHPERRRQPGGLRDIDGYGADRTIGGVSFGEYLAVHTDDLADGS